MEMDINAEVSTHLSLIDAILHDIEKTPNKSCASKNYEIKKEENQDAMPDSTTSADKNHTNTFHCGDDVLVPNKDGRYYLGTIVELSTNNDNDSCEVGTGVARCLVKFGDGTHSWAAVATLKLLSAPPSDDGRIMCVVCKQREGAASSPQGNSVIACDMCGRGYHAKCHTPPVESWINGASWHCKRCVEQRYRVAAAENRALKPTDFFRFKGNQQRQHQEMSPCDTASTTSSTASDIDKDGESHCYCGDKSDWLAQMLLCCRCSRWFHQRCVSSIQYPLYAGDKLYIFACSDCNGGSEYLRRLELGWLDLAHLALYNLTAYNAPNYFDLDSVIMPYIKDNWHALQLSEKMWRTPANERRDRILTALTSSRKRFKCGREMKKRATIWGLRLRRPPSPPIHLAAFLQLKKGEPLTDKLVKEYAPRLRFLPRAPSPQTAQSDDSPSSSNGEKSSYKSQRMIVPVDGHWLNLMMGKRFHENINSNSEDSTSSYDSKPLDAKCISPSHSTPTKNNAKDISITNNLNGATSRDVQCLLKVPKQEIYQEDNRVISNVDMAIHNSRIATMNMEVAKLSTKNIIEHSKIMSLQHMDSSIQYCSLNQDFESSGDETSSRGTLDAIIPPLKDFMGKNNPFLMKNKSDQLVSRKNCRQSLPGHLGSYAAPLVRPLKRKLSEKDIVIGPNGEVKRKKFRRPKKYLNEIQLLNKSCPLPTETFRNLQGIDNECKLEGTKTTKLVNKAKNHGRRLRQRPEKNYYENARRTSNPAMVNSVKSLQLSPHKANGNGESDEAELLSALKSSVQSYFRVGQTYQVLARRFTPGQPPTYLVQWE